MLLQCSSRVTCCYYVVCSLLVVTVGLFLIYRTNCWKKRDSFLFYSILFYSILFCSILFYSILSYPILSYPILFCSILFYSILFYFILFYSILFYPILFYSILFYSFIFCSINLIYNLEWNTAVISGVSFQMVHGYVRHLLFLLSF